MTFDFVPTAVPSKPRRAWRNTVVAATTGATGLVDATCSRLWHYALDDQYLRRNPFLVPPDPCVDLMDPPTCPPVFPISATLPRFNELWTLNRFTAACGICVYRDRLLGKESSHSVFVCEPAYNLVYRGILQSEGATFRCVRGAEEQHSEFLASRDHWFRPVQTRTGPDGALWIVDMYRLIIEHPDYIPEKWHQDLDFDAGADAVVSIVWCTPKRRRAACRRSRDLPPNSSWRHCIPPTGPSETWSSGCLSKSRITRPCRRSDSWCCLQRCLSRARRRWEHSMACRPLMLPCCCSLIKDPHPALRRHAIRLSIPLLSDHPELASRLSESVTDPDKQVRMQLAYTLGEWNDPRAGLVLAEIAIGDATDPLIIAAVMSSAARHPKPMLERILAVTEPTAEQVELIQNLLRLVLDSEQYEPLVLGLQRIATRHAKRYAPWQYALLADLIVALEDNGETYRQFRDRASVTLQQAIDRTARVFEQARQDMVDAQLPVSLRVDAIRLMGRDPQETEAEPGLLSNLLVPQEPVAVQAAAVDALARLEPVDLPAVLLDQWVQHGPEIRTRIVSDIVGSPGLDRNSAGSHRGGASGGQRTGATNRNRLILHSDSRVRRRASQLLAGTAQSQCAQTIERFRTLLSQPASADAGRAVFKKQCATCHQLEGEGKNIGPDLLALTDRSSDSLLVSILDPDRAVEPRYVAYSVVTERGRVLSGIISRETGNSLTLIDCAGR